MVNEVCIDCLYKQDCPAPCSAIRKLTEMCNKQDQQEKEEYIKGIASQLDLNETEASPEMEEMANMIINHFEQFAFIKEDGIKIGYVISYDKRKQKKVKYADCRKVHAVYKAFLPFDYIITFYDTNTDILSENQKKILMLHELKHIGYNNDLELTLIDHDIEDFEDILKKYGLDWNKYGQEMPDILG
jgi:predicted metallopeptidase